MDAALGERPDGTWASDEVGLVEPRQNGKSALLEARSLGGLYLFNEKLIVWTAHEFKTAREGFLRFRELVTNYDHLRRRVRAVRVAAGEEGVELLNGCRLRFLARSGGSGRGFSGDTVFLDESYALIDEQMAALMPTMSARPNPQVWYTSSGPRPNSLVLRRLCKRGRKGSSSRLTYFEWCGAADAASDDRQAWADANPALGSRISEEAVERELAAMDDETFRLERLGIWHDEDEGDSVIPAAAWTASVDEASQIVGAVALAVDVTPDRASAVIAVAGTRGDGRLHGEVVQQGAGTGWVVQRLTEIAERWNPSVLVLDPSGPAGSLIPALARAGFEADGSGRWRLHIIGTREAAQAAGALVDDVVEDRFRHLDQAPLNAALAGAKTRPLADAWAWSRRHSGVDISPLVAVTLARHGAEVHGGSSYDVLGSIW